MTPTLPITDIPAAANGVHAPTPVAEPPVEEEEFDPDFLARLRELDWLDGEYNAGRLRPYCDEYVISAHQTILAHSHSLESAHVAVEKKADELGIPRSLLAIYYCCCS